MNSVGFLLIAFSLSRLDESLLDVDVELVEDDDEVDDDDDCFLRGVINLFKEPTLPPIMPPSELTSNS